MIKADSATGETYDTAVITENKYVWNLVVPWGTLQK